MKKEHLPLDDPCKKRILIMTLCVFVCFLAIIARLFYVQVIDCERYKKLVLRDAIRWKPIDRKRGTIYDRNKKVFAVSKKVDSLYAVPKKIVNIKEVIKILAKIFGKKEDYYFEKMMNNRSFVWIERHLTPEVKSRIKALKIKGLNFRKEYKRFYPNKTLASTLIGFVGIDNIGLEGLEHYFNWIIEAEAGWESYTSDTRGYKLPIGKVQRLSPKGGNQIVLTIDEVIQHIAEEEIEKIMTQYEAKQAFGIINSPETGEILAMVNLPNYDLNEFRTTKEKNKRNRCITDIYEPGSTFKLISVVAAMEKGNVKPDDVFECRGSIIAGGHKIKCHGSHGKTTYEIGIANSCNPITIQAIRKAGKKNFYDVIKNFGFGELTGINLPGEVRGRVHDYKRWAEIDFASISMGQAISVTPLQLLCAVSGIVNDGILVQPRIVKEILDSDENPVVRFRAEKSRRVCTLKTSRAIKKMMSKVVEIGTGKRAAFMNFIAGGKTGTAQKAGNDGKYAKGKYVTSFVGFVPIENPKFGMLVIVDEPKGREQTGGSVAAKAFKRIAERTLEYMGYFDRKVDPDTKRFKLPDFRQKTAMQVFDLLEESKCLFNIEGSGDIVGHQYPEPGSQVSDDTVVYLYFVDSIPDKDKSISDVFDRMPFVHGKTVKQVLTIFKDKKVQLKLKGSGIAFKQDPNPGEIILSNTECIIEFKEE